MIERRSHQRIGLGDLIRAIGELNASDGEAMKVAELLGLRLAGAALQLVAEQRSVTATAIGAATGASTSTGAAKVGSSVPLTAQSSASARSESAIGDGEILLTFVGSDTPPARSWISDADELAEPAVSAALPYDATVPTFEPLLAPAITRAVVATAAATRADDGPIDVDQLIHDVAIQRPIRALPCLPTTTLRRGVQILVDRTASMQPFHVDADDLAARIRRVASQGATQLLYFDEDPRVVDDTWPVGEGRLHELPPAGTPLLLITDLGIRNLQSNRSRARACWWEFATKALRRRCPIMAFVPYPLSRWPAGLSGLITPLLWDRKTTVAAIRAARRNEGC